MASPKETLQPDAIEIEIFRQTQSTARSWDDFIQVFNIPIIERASVLDVGGGGSDVTAHFLEQGMDAYAIDPAYKSRSDVKGRVRKHIAGLRSRFGKDPIWVKHIKKEEDALERFTESIKENPDHYKPAYATSIPFPDESFDMVFSWNCITEYLDLDEGLLLKAVKECLRVTKKGGMIQLHPFNDLPRFQQKDNPQMAARNYRIRIENQETMLRYLKETGVRYAELPAGPSLNMTLLIVKPE